MGQWCTGKISCPPFQVKTHKETAEQIMAWVSHLFQTEGVELQSEDSNDEQVIFESV